MKYCRIVHLPILLKDGADFRKFGEGAIVSGESIEIEQVRSGDNSAYSREEFKAALTYLKDCQEVM